MGPRSGRRARMCRPCRCTTSCSSNPRSESVRRRIAPLVTCRWIGPPCTHEPRRTRPNEPGLLGGQPWASAQQAGAGSENSGRTIALALRPEQFAESIPQAVHPNVAMTLARRAQRAFGAASVVLVRVTGVATSTRLPPGVHHGDNYSLLADTLGTRRPAV